MKLFYSLIVITFCFSLETQNIYDNSWALIIGIDKYESVQKLNYAVKDAQTMQDILLNTFAFPSENITLLIDEKANKQSILQSFSNITKNANENDVLNLNLQKFLFKKGSERLILILQKICRLLKR